MGLMFVLVGLLGAAGTIAGFAYRPIREIERVLPDVADYPSLEDTSTTGRVQPSEATRKADSIRR